MTDWNEMAKDVAVGQAQRRRDKARLIVYSCGIRDLAHREANLCEARRVFQQFAKEVQQQIEHHISLMVNHCVTAVFNRRLGFRLRFVSKRGKTEADLFFHTKGGREQPMDAKGGGIIDVTAYALRFAVLRMLGKLRPGSMLVLDEPFRFVSPTYRDGLGRMLESSANEFGIQFLIVTHDDLPAVSGRTFSLCAGRVGTVLEGKARVKEAKPGRRRFRR